jgi:hypothetical protein
MIYHLLLDYSSSKLTSRLNNLLFRTNNHLLRYAVEAVTQKLAVLRDNPFDEYDNEWSKRTYALMKYNVRRRIREPRFEHATPPLLLVNKAIHSEALGELRLSPLVINNDISTVFDRFFLTLAHFIPLPSLQQIEHVHFEQDRPAIEVYKILWKGGKITKDMNGGKVRRNAYFLGMFRGSGEKEAEFMSLRKVSFQLLCDEPMVLDLADEKVVSCVRDSWSTKCVLT